MALTRCHECQSQVSTEASSCPHCGVPQQKSAAALDPVEVQRAAITKKGSTVARVFGAVALTVVIVGGCGIFLAAVNAPSRPSFTTTSAPERARFKIKIERSRYEYGYLKLTGTVENVGTGSAFSPT